MLGLAISIPLIDSRWLTGEQAASRETRDSFVRAAFVERRLADYQLGSDRSTGRSRRPLRRRHASPHHEDLAVACDARSGVAITYLGGEFP